MMKKLLILPLLLVLGLSAHAQQNILKVNPFGLLFGQLNLTYERVLNENSSLELGASYWNIGATVSGDDADLSGVGVNAMYKFYIGAKDSPRGIYVGPAIGYFNVSATANDEKSSASALSIGGLFGHQWAWGDPNGFVLDLGIGAAYYNASADDDITSFSLDGVGPLVRVAIGYSF